jgi:hypothetical protein
VQTVTLAALLEREQFPPLGIGLEVVEARNGLCGVLERGVS